ncbi:MAG: fumarylacetoacetate hydrolase family protein [Herpetosiphonaceae bacterium]|nr:fumarylacetoacetate hydrolase family protein [Herpetosiphonaceae bacterium]
MRLYCFESAGRERLGAEVDSRLVDLAAAHAAMSERVTTAPTLAAFPADMLALVRAGGAAISAATSTLNLLRQAPTTTTQLFYKFDAVRLRAPVRPGKILCSGVNYRSHQEENPGAKLPGTPGFFSKLPSAVIGPGEAIVCPRMTTQLDYEVELAVVIGRTLHKASEAEAIAAIFGYTILHDVSARDIQFKEPQNNQITLGKNFDTFAPIGPCIVTADELPHPDHLRLRTFVNDQLLQDGSTDQWLFPLPYLLAFLSQIMTLEPGDIVTTGTPSGVGVFRQPQRFLQPGDRVCLEIEGIGRLENAVIAEI